MIALDLALLGALLVAGGGVVLNLGGLAGVATSQHADERTGEQWKRRGYVWMGLFQLLVASILVRFAAQHGDGGSAWTSVPALALVGLGFVAAGLRLPQRYLAWRIRAR